MYLQGLTMRGDMIHLRRNFEIGRFLQLKSEIRNFELDPGRRCSPIPVFGFWI